MNKQVSEGVNLVADLCELVNTSVNPDASDSDATLVADLMRTLAVRAGVSGTQAKQALVDWVAGAEYIGVPTEADLAEHGEDGCEFTRADLRVYTAIKRAQALGLLPQH